MYIYFNNVGMLLPLEEVEKMTASAKQSRVDVGLAFNVDRYAVSCDEFEPKGEAKLFKVKSLDGAFKIFKTDGKGRMWTVALTGELLEKTLAILKGLGAVAIKITPEGYCHNDQYPLGTLGAARMIDGKCPKCGGDNIWFSVEMLTAPRPAGGVE